MSEALEALYDCLAASLPDAAEQKSFAVTSGLAEAGGLRDESEGRPSQHHTWSRTDGDTTLQFEWYWRDQSRPFSIQPDLNVLTVSLRRGDSVLRSASARYED